MTDRARPLSGLPPSPVWNTYIHTVTRWMMCDVCLVYIPMFVPAVCTSRAYQRTKCGRSPPATLFMPTCPKTLASAELRSILKHHPPKPGFSAQSIKPPAPSPLPTRFFHRELLWIQAPSTVILQSSLVLRYVQVSKHHHRSSVWLEDKKAHCMLVSHPQQYTLLVRRPRDAFYQIETPSPYRDRTSGKTVNKSIHNHK